MAGDDIPDFIKELLGGEDNETHGVTCKCVTVGAHYGVSEKEYDGWVRQAFILNVELSDRSAVLDKMFPELTGEQRAKIQAYHAGVSLYEDDKPKLVPGTDKTYRNKDDEDEDEPRPRSKARIVGVSVTRRPRKK
jgi:hypothetical protein